MTRFFSSAALRFAPQRATACTAALRSANGAPLHFASPRNAMNDDPFDRLIRFVRDGGSTRAALDRAREEVDYWRDLAENYLHRIKSVQLENTGLYGKLVEKDRALAYKENELHSVRLEIAEFRQVTETGHADRGIVRAVASRVRRHRERQCLRSACSSNIY